MEEETTRDFALILLFGLRYCSIHGINPLVEDEAISNIPHLEDTDKLVRQLTVPEIELVLVAGALGKKLIVAAKQNSRENWLYQPMSDFHTLLQNSLYANFNYTNYRERKGDGPRVGIRRYQGHLWFVEREPNKGEQVADLMKKITELMEKGP